MENVSGGSNKIIIAVLMVVIIAAAGITYALTSGLVPMNPADPNNTTTFSEPIEGIDNSLKILGDAEMVATVDEYGFPGSGSQSDPYIIENLSIVSEGNCIEIRDVEASFEIRNCALGIYSWHYSAIGIYLRNCDSASIVNCRLEGGISGIEFFECDGIRIVDCFVKNSIFGINSTISQSPEITNNMVMSCMMGVNLGISNFSEVTSNLLYNNSQGITAYGSYYCTVNANNITECSIGIEIGYDGGNCTITDNWIVHNTEYGIKLGEFTLGILIYGNSLGWNGISNALDDGIINAWDVEDETGNFWHDYSGEGVYTIPGSAESVDHYPQLLEG
ncbi:MAG: NosD domain-containing protein [Candidatus Thorarchaeota archaeon]